jgi:hypothetical protein
MPLIFNLTPGMTKENIQIEFNTQLCIGHNLLCMKSRSCMQELQIIHAWAAHAYMIRPPDGFLWVRVVILLFKI